MLFLMDSLEELVVLQPNHKEHHLSWPRANRPQYISLLKFIVAMRRCARTPSKQKEQKKKKYISKQNTTEKIVEKKTDPRGNNKKKVCPKIHPE